MAPVYAQRVSDIVAASFDPLKSAVPTVLDAGKGEKAEVRQFFAYWCPHCASLEASYMKWEKSAPKSIKLIRTPVAFGEPQKPLATLFYVLETFPNATDLHVAVFSAVHNTRTLQVNAPATKLIDFAVDALKLPRTKVEAAWASFGVQTKLRQGIAALDTYDIESIPTFIVQGRYKTSPARMAASPSGSGLRGDALYDAMFKAIEAAAV
jgi:thiol:disulfide interchange protein DsbA